MHPTVSWGCIAALNLAVVGLAGANTIPRKYPPVTVVDQALEFRQFEKVEITGSSIVRKEQTQALPVQVITRDDIRRSGLKSVTEVVQALPLMGNFVESSQLGMVAGGYSNAAIHGMPNGTLVLVNGLRLAPFGRATVVGTERASVDLNTLPLADVDRIEVLSDGASSLYGTDAIAGVVNIILRQERKGVEISADAIRPQGGAGQGWVSSIGWGHGELRRHGYSMMITAEASQRHEVLGRDRPYTSKAVREFEHAGEAHEAYGSYYTVFTSPATVRERPSASRPSGDFVNHLYQNGRCTEGSIRFNDHAACFRNAYPSLGIYPAEENLRLHARGARQLRPGLTVFADLLLGRHLALQSNNWWTESRSAYGLSEGSVGYEQALQAGMDPAQTRLLWMPDLPALRSASLQTNGRVSAGLQGEWQEWHYRSRAYLAQSRAQSQVDTLGRLDYRALGIGFDETWTNAGVLRPLDATNPLTTQLEALRGGLKNASTGTNRISGLQVHGSRPLTEINGEDVALGVGFDIRNEISTFSNHVPLNLQAEAPDYSAKRQVRAAHAELQIPLTSEWELNMGWRSDQYSDVGTTHNGKIFSRWQISPQWSMRGSVGTGFRAPSAGQTTQLPNSFIYGQATQAIACDAQQLAIAERLGTSGNSAGTCYNGSFPYVLGNGNPDLKPEKSQQVTWGLAFMPHRNLRLALDLWSVQVRDMIQPLSPLRVLNEPLRYESNYQLMPAQNNNGIMQGTLALYLPMQNLGVQEKQGIDLEAQWRRPGDWGRWSVNAQATYLLRSRTQDDSLSQATSDLGRYDETTASVSPKWRTRIVSSLTRENWTAMLILHHTSGYQDAPVWATRLSDGTGSRITRRVGSFTTWDAHALYSAGRNIDLRIGVRNLLNQQAPLSFASNSIQVFGANTVESNVWGRTWQVGATLRF